MEGITNIEWTTYGKIKKITRIGGSIRPDLEFAYDPSGNRVMKLVIPRTGGMQAPVSEWTWTYYSRDAQGNVLSTYELKKPSLGPNLFTQLEAHIYGSSRLGLDERGLNVLTTKICDPGKKSEGRVELNDIGLPASCPTSYITVDVGTIQINQSNTVYWNGAEITAIALALNINQYNSIPEYIAEVYNAPLI